MYLLFSKLIHPCNCVWAYRKYSWPQGAPNTRTEEKKSGDLGDRSLLCCFWFVFGPWSRGVLGTPVPGGWAGACQPERDPGSPVLPLLSPHQREEVKTTSYIRVPHGSCNLWILELSSHYRPVSGVSVPGSGVHYGLNEILRSVAKTVIAIVSTVGLQLPSVSGRYKYMCRR